MSLHIHGNLQSAVYQTVTIDSLPDAVLLEIFEDFLVEKLNNPRWFPKEFWVQSEPHQFQWYDLVPAHVCQRWRQIIIASPGRLQLSVFCSWGLPIADILRHSPPEIPLSIYFPHSIRFGFAKTYDAMASILLALGHLDRARHISIDGSRLELDQILLMMNRPPPKLATLSVTSHEPTSLPPSFTIEGNECLRELDFENIRYPLPTAPTLTKFCFRLYDLDGNIPGPTSNVLQDLACHLRTMPLSEHLALEPLVPQDVLPIEDRTRISLPKLSTLVFKGWHSHLEDLISIIDAPVLRNLDISIRGDWLAPFALPELAGRIRASPMFSASAAEVGFNDSSVYIKTSSEAGCIQISAPRKDEVRRHDDEGWDDFFATPDQEVLESFLMTIHSALAPVLPSVKTLVLAFDEEDGYFRDEDGNISSIAYAFIYAFNFDVVLKLFRSVTSLRLDRVIAEAVCEVMLWLWIESVPELKDITICFEGRALSGMVERFSYELLHRRRLLDLPDVVLHSRVYPPMEKLYRHEDLILRRR